MTRSLSSSRALLFTVTAALAVTGCTKPKQTTGISAAAGGAIGAGLGAIVGNQTGNAASGLAIGAVAGAATGALIGNALQAQQETGDSQKETLGRQEKSIRAQRSEIDELRRMQSDSGYSSGKNQNVSAYLVEEKRLQLQKRGPSPRSQEGASRYSPPLLAQSSEPLARYDIKSTNQPTLKNTTPTSAVATLPKKATSTSLNAKGIKEKDLASTASSQANASQAETTQDTSIAKVAMKSEPTETCAESKEARNAAAGTSDDSDKLFHLRKALRLCPNSAETHYELGKAYLNMDRAADANYEFKQALSIDPSYAAAKESLKDIDQGKSHY